MKAKFFESERLWFRAPEPDDASYYTRALQNREVNRHLLVGSFPFNEFAERKFIEARSTMPSFSDATDVLLAVGRKGDEAIVGGTGLHRINWQSRSCEWGIFIGDPSDWNQGFGREIARRMLRYAFMDLNLNRVMLHVNANNDGGVKCYEAAGFVREGVLRQDAFIDGAYVDRIVMSVLRDEWDASSLS